MVQALGQCRKFLAEKLPLAQTIKMPSTAAAARALLNNPLDCAAICSSICATLYEGIEVLFTNIQNEQCKSLLTLVKYFLYSIVGCTQRIIHVFIFQLTLGTWT